MHTAPRGMENSKDTHSQVNKWSPSHAHTDRLHMHREHVATEPQCVWIGNSPSHTLSHPWSGTDCHENTHRLTDLRTGRLTQILTPQLQMTHPAAASHVRASPASAHAHGHVVPARKANPAWPEPPIFPGEAGHLTFYVKPFTKIK